MNLWVELCGNTYRVLIGEGNVRPDETIDSAKYEVIWEERGGTWDDTGFPYSES